MTTREKIGQLVRELETMRLGDVDEGARGLMELYYMAKGFGFDVIDLLVPKTDADADHLVDALITLCLEVRGDDLPRFDLERHVRDSTAANGDDA